MTIEVLLSRSHEICSWLDQQINGLAIKSADKLRLAAACFDQGQEHAKAVCLLLDQPKAHRLVGSACSLVRPTFETFVRGLWLRHCATDQEIARFQEDKLEKKLVDIVQAVESKSEYGVGVLARLKRKYWRSMCSYAHGGYLQASRRIRVEHIEPQYLDEEIEEVIRFTCVFALLAGHEVFSMARKDNLKDEVLARIKDLHPQAT